MPEMIKARQLLCFGICPVRGNRPDPPDEIHNMVSTFMVTLRKCSLCSFICLIDLGCGQALEVLRERITQGGVLPPVFTQQFFAYRMTQTLESLNHLHGNSLWDTDFGGVKSLLPSHPTKKAARRQLFVVYTIKDMIG